LKNGNGGFGRGWRKRRHKSRGNKGRIEGRWGWLVNGGGYKGLIAIRGIEKMYDTVYTGFNLNLDRGRSVESGSKGTGKSTEFRGYIRGRIWESIHPVFSCA
jgi:hypothetical protein